ncbi:MAG: type I DNA topoisomerase [Bacteroidales bacterium]|jgi:DNA topoisomerase-1|nr:type I DNA topoisomerase [Bacteroidales bacterium]MDY0313507.1 type I DNA topoisomerase [Bacteroidales bacterium]NLB86184.1 type I DNA topoisomerase [Bacteroidales bacterium]
MSTNLVIVESPAKAKTIKKFLGDDFVVKSSFGHIRDLSKKNLGIDIENGFIPQYEIPVEKKKVVAELKKHVSEAKVVWLASDEDREGEAISWHLKEVLNLKKIKTKRIVFHEITKDAIQNAIKNPREIDNNLVNAQQARRVLDRLVGFNLSPLLWKKIKPALSAGRVQSVAVKLIVEREREINSFASNTYYRIVGFFKVGKSQIKAELNKKFKTLEEAQAFLETCKTEEFAISDIVKKPGKKSPAAPFTTSTLQQEAGRKLGYSVGQTMKFAQSLYENGFITYMRTDSVNLSNLAIGSSKKFIENTFGAEYVKTRKYTTKIKGAQEAHEAIRPTFIETETIDGTKQEQKLYDLIRKRTIASQMQDAKIERTIITINNVNNKINFIATGEVVVFDGFLKLYIESTDDENADETQSILPLVKKGDKAIVSKIEANQKFEQAPYRYSEASLVKKMEELGIGRPSTYAPTISTIQQREYVIKESRSPKNREIINLILENGKIEKKKEKEKFGGENNKLFPTSMGVVVTDYLINHFDNILSYDFTAKIEEEFDKIAIGKIAWDKMLSKFYETFSIQVETSLKEKETTKWEREIGIHPETGLPIVLRIGKYGPYASIEGTETPRYASLRKNQNVESVSLEEVLDLFKLPRNIGTYEDDDLIVAIGKYGPYVKNNGKFYSIKKQDDPYTINKERAIEIIKEKVSQQKEAFSRTFDEMPGLKILKGRYGPYISYEKKNYRIPKTYDPEKMDLEDCKIIISKSKKV